MATFSLSALSCALVIVVGALPAHAGWQHADTGVGSENIEDVHFPSDASTGWLAAGQTNVYRTTDAGFNWISQNAGGFLRYYYGLHFIDDGSSVGDMTGYVVGGILSGVVRKTTNGGSDWGSDLSLPGGAGILRAVFFASVHPYTTGWAVGDGGTIIKTDNGGVSWISQGTGSDDLRDIHFPVDTVTGWAVGYNDTILKTEDGGATWSPQSPPTSGIIFSGVHFPVDTTTGYVVGNYGTALKTTDGGATWNPQTTSTTTWLRCVHFPENADTGYITGNNGIILKTTDGGLNWRPQQSNTTESLLKVQFLNNNVGYAVGTAGVVLTTTDGGEPPCVPISTDDVTCDNIDDDCDGTTDDDYALDASCGVGHCYTTNTPSSCDGGVEIPCQPGSQAEFPDITCDGIDGDCDGLVDEDAIRESVCNGSSSTVCEVSVCDPAAAGCVSSRISSCCEAEDSECTTSSPCISGACDLASHTCAYDFLPACCTADTDCDDGNACTSDTCDVATGACESVPIVACCNSSADCDDGDPCSLDTCTPDLRCQYRPRECASNGPCGTDTSCVYSGVGLRLGSNTPAGSVVSGASAVAVLQFDVATEALPANLRVVTLRVSAAGGLPDALQQYVPVLYPDDQGDGVLDAGVPPLSTAARKDWATGAFVFSDIGHAVPASSSQSFLVVLEPIKPTADLSGCQSTEAHRTYGLWLAVVLAIYMRKLFRSRPRRAGRQMGFLLLMVVFATVPLSACGRVGFGLKPQHATISIESNADIVMNTDPGAALHIWGAPVVSLPFEIRSSGTHPRRLGD